MNRRHSAKLAALAAPALLVAVMGASNIDNTVPNKYGWGENVGWTNWFDANAGAQGALVGPRFMSGFVWGENVGWINLGDGTPTNGLAYANVNDTDFGVNIASNGNLSGMAWGENVGWINFSGGALATPPQPARVRCASLPGQPRARLSGYAWGENIGWLNLDDATTYVSLDLAGTPILCDVNHDGFKNGRDVQSFVTILTTGGATWLDVCSGDTQAVPNGTLDTADIPPFITCLLTAP